jgi:hypothetical protein
MKASAGKVMVVSAMVLVLGMAAASNATAASKNNSASTNGAIWGGDNSTRQSGPATAQGHQVEQSTREHGCFTGTASESARCIARGLAKKVVSLVEGATWGGSGGWQPPR